MERFGPDLRGRDSHALHNPQHNNMKELRFDAAGGVWRVAYAFDSNRQAGLLAAGDKRAVEEKAFYERLIKIANGRLDAHEAKFQRTEQQGSSIRRRAASA